MTANDKMNPTPATPSTSETDLPDRTVRIEHDRRRLALRTLASAFSLAATCTALVVTLLHIGDGTLDRYAVTPAVRAFVRATGTPWWAPVAVGLAVVGSAIGVLRNLYRLQDADPALVISPRGLSFRPSLFGETVCIPWSAIRGIRIRRHKHQRSIAVAVADIDRHVAHLGLRARLHNLFRSGTPEVLFSSPMAVDAWTRTERMLQDYLARYRKNHSQDHVPE